MNPKFWQQRWETKQIGFNQPDINPLLKKYFDHLKLAKDSRILVPLCGKSIDMMWLIQQGYNVVGIELVETAVQEFFSEHAIAFEIIEHQHDANIKCYQGEVGNQSISVWVGDIFELSATDMGHIDAVYDRAALIAMPSEMRPRYSNQVIVLSADTNAKNPAPQLVLTLNYDQNQRQGPPFSISSENVQQYYSAHYHITELEGEPAILNAAPEMAVKEYVWLLTPR